MINSGKQLHTVNSKLYGKQIVMNVGILEQGLPEKTLIFVFYGVFSSLNMHFVLVMLKSP